MPERIKNLGQVKPAAATTVVLYTVPATWAAVCSCICVCNQAGTTDFRVSIGIAGAPDDQKQYLYWNTVIGPNDTISVVMGITLSAGDVVRVSSTAGTVSFHLFGSEVS